MSERLPFLHALLPRVARKAVFHVSLNLPPKTGEAKGTWKPVSCSTVEEVCAVLDEHADEAEIYVALAAFRPGAGRKKNAVVAKNWISADVDDKAMPGTTPEERHANALRLAQSVPVPKVVVDSGFGAHVHIRLPQGDRVEDFDDPAKGIAHVELLMVALRRFLESHARELFGVDVGLDHTHGAERVWRVPPGVNCKAGDGAKTLTADRSRWRPVRLLGQADGLADTPPADLAFLAPYMKEEAETASVASVATKNGFETALLPPRLRDQWPMSRGDQSENDFAVAAALARAGHPPSVVWQAIRERRATLSDPEDRAKGERADYVDKTVDAAFARAKTERPSKSLVPKTPWPERVDDAALHGLAGEFVQLVLPHSEADPMSLLSQFLVGFGSLVGRGPHFRAEADYHCLNLYVVLVGETAKGRKGTSWGHVERVLVALDSTWQDRIGAGLSSGEGLIWQVRDEIWKKSPVRKKGRVVGYEDVLADEGVKDKRLLVQEAEYATALRVLGRDGNTLSPVIRTAWDKGNLRSMTKNSPAKATGALISIVGHITKQELLRYLTRTEAGNGFGNRFLWICVRRSKLLPEGGRVPQEALDDLVVRLREVVAFARGVGEMSRDDAARVLWHEIYRELSEGKPGLLGAMIARAEAQVMRVACADALLDKSAVVRVEHLRAALAVWKYSEQSARYVFGDALGDPLADEALRVIQGRPRGASRTQLRDHFGRHAKGNDLDRALDLLRELGFADMRHDQTGGRPAEVWFATSPGRDKSDQSDETPHSAVPPATSVASDAFVAPGAPAHDANPGEAQRGDRSDESDQSRSGSEATDTKKRPYTEDF